MQRYSALFSTVREVTGEGRGRETYDVEDDVLAVGFLHEARERGGERRGVEEAGVGDDADDGEERALAYARRTAV